MEITKLFSLNGKTALVTGASSGLGRQMALTLAGAGAQVIALGRNKERLSDICSSIEKIGSTALQIQCDLSKPKEIEKALNELSSQKVDILINNAGIAGMTPIDEPNLELWDNQIATNLKAVWQLSQGISSQMANKNIAGSIINISSINGGNVPYSAASGYSATKAAVCQLSKVLSGELAKINIRVNTILPGLFSTELTSAKIEAGRNEYEKAIPLGFIAEPEDLDGLILFLASNKASRYVTGAEFVIDGGISANCKGI